jgi:hypothetical protein
VQIIDTSPMGTRSAVLRLRRKGSELQFLVFPMLHVAEQSFYDEVRRRLADCAVVVAEGVTGRSALATAVTMTYRVIPANRRSGLVRQNLGLDALGVPVIRPDVSAKEFGRAWRTLPLGLRLSVWCLLPVATVLQLVGGRKRLLAPAIALDDDDVSGDETTDRLDGVFGGERDDRLFAALVELHEQRSAERIDVAVVYGAQHVPDLVHRLASTLGYRPRTADWITAVNW